MKEMTLQLQAIRNLPCPEIEAVVASCRESAQSLNSLSATYREAQSVQAAILAHAQEASQFRDFLSAAVRPMLADFLSGVVAESAIDAKRIIVRSGDIFTRIQNYLNQTGPMPQEAFAALDRALEQELIPVFDAPLNADEQEQLDQNIAELLRIAEEQRSMILQRDGLTFGERRRQYLSILIVAETSLKTGPLLRPSPIQERIVKAGKNAQTASCRKFRREKSAKWREVAQTHAQHLWQKKPSFKTNPNGTARQIMDAVNKKLTEMGQKTMSQGAIRKALSQSLRGTTVQPST
jgi:hypothetical protein